MTHAERPHLSPEEIDPLVLTALLERHGWQLVGGRSGKYNRLAPPGQSEGLRGGALVIPTDRGAPEYIDEMISALKTLIVSTPVQFWQGLAAAGRFDSPKDEYRVAKETGAPSGLIRWQDGEGLFGLLRATLIAGAKAFLEPSPVYSNRLRRFARRYLDLTLMGQTQFGSYVVTAYVPTSEYVPLRTDRVEGLPLEGVNVATTREITRGVARSIAAASRALERSKEEDSLGPFIESVPNGVSYELLVALAGIASGSQGATVAVAFDPRLPDEEFARGLTFQLEPPDALVLDAAGRALLTTEPRHRVTVVGRVHLLEKKEFGLPGLIGVEGVATEGPKRVKAHLTNPDDYHSAVRAHDLDLFVQVSGTLRREGTQNWLDEARIDQLIHPDEMSAAQPENAESPEVDDSEFDDEQEPLF